MVACKCGNEINIATKFLVGNCKLLHSICIVQCEKCNSIAVINLEAPKEIARIEKEDEDFESKT
jgi:hypothetical protein